MRNLHYCKVTIEIINVVATTEQRNTYNQTDKITGRISNDNNVVSSRHNAKHTCNLMFV